MRLHKNLFFLTLLVFVFSCKSTQKSLDDQSASLKEEVVNYDLEDALLWKIEGNGLTKSSYLFGTIHMIKKENFYWPKGTLAALDDSEKAAFEVDLDDMFDVSAQMGMITKAFMKDNQTLADFYSEEDYRFVKPKVRKQANTKWLSMAHRRSQ